MRRHDHTRRNTTLRLFAGISVTTGAENPTDCAIAATARGLADPRSGCDREGSDRMLGCSGPLRRPLPPGTRPCPRLFSGPSSRTAAWLAAGELSEWTAFGLTIAVKIVADVWVASDRAFMRSQRRELSSRCRSDVSANFAKHKRDGAARSQGHASSISASAPSIAATSKPADPEPMSELSETAFATIFPSRAWAQKRASEIVACPAPSVFTDKVSRPIASVHPTAGCCDFWAASRSAKATSTAPPPRR